MDDDNKQMETFEAEKELPSEFKPQVDIHVMAMIRVKAVAVAVISTNIMCLIYIGLQPCISIDWDGCSSGTTNLLG